MLLGAASSPHTYVKPAGVSPGLSQGARAVNDLLFEAQQPCLQQIPFQTFI